MDYGQTAQPNGVNETPDFFTVGAGTNSVSLNDVAPENNLDLSNDATDWGAPAQHDTHNLGNAAINAPLSNPDAEVPSSEIANSHAPNPNRAPSFSDRTSELGKIINLEMPPDSQMEALTVEESHSRPSDSASELSVDTLSAKRDSISPEALRIAEHAVANFEKGKITPAELSDFKWNATKAYLKNSFGRDLAA